MGRGWMADEKAAMPRAVEGWISGSQSEQQPWAPALDSLVSGPTGAGVEQVELGATDPAVNRPAAASCTGASIMPVGEGDHLQLV